MKVKNCANCAYSIQGEELLDDQCVCTICKGLPLIVDVDHFCDNHDIDPDSEESK